MESESTVIEKKAYQKLETKEGAYAAISPFSNKIGRIVNISLGGLVFKYIDREKEADTFGEIIFLGNFGFNLSDLSLRTTDFEHATVVEGIEVHEEDNGMAFSDTPSYKPENIRQQWLQFAELTFKQIFAVDKFIRNNVRPGDLNMIQVMVE